MYEIRYAKRLPPSLRPCIHNRSMNIRIIGDHSHNMLLISAKSSTKLNFTANYGGFYFFVIEILRLRGDVVDIGGNALICVFINTSVTLNSCGITVV